MSTSLFCTHLCESIQIRCVASKRTMAGRAADEASRVAAEIAAAMGGGPASPCAGGDEGPTTTGAVDVMLERVVRLDAMLESAMNRIEEVGRNTAAVEHAFAPVVEVFQRLRGGASSSGGADSEAGRAVAADVLGAIVATVREACREARQNVSDDIGALAGELEIGEKLAVLDGLAAEQGIRTIDGVLGERTQKPAHQIRQHLVGAMFVERDELTRSLNELKGRNETLRGAIAAKKQELSQAEATLGDALVDIGQLCEPGVQWAGVMEEVLVKENCEPAVIH